MNRLTPTEIKNLAHYLATRLTDTHPHPHYDADGLANYAVEFLDNHDDDEGFAPSNVIAAVCDLWENRDARPPWWTDPADAVEALDPGDHVRPASFGGLLP